MKQNIPNENQKSWSANTAQKIQELNQQLAKTKNHEERQDLKTALQVQWDYLERIAKAAEQRKIYQSLSQTEQENKWEELRTRLTTRENQTEGEREQISYDLFALLDRSQIQDQVVANLGKLGIILNPKALNNLKSFSEGGWYDSVNWALEQLNNNEVGEISEEIVWSVLLFVLYEIKSLAINTAQELNLDIDF